MMYWSEGMTAIGPKECRNAVSACRRVSQDLRQMSSALMVLKKLRRIRKPSGRLFSRRKTAAVSEQVPFAAHRYLEAMPAPDLLVASH